MMPFNVLFGRISVGGANAIAGHGAVGYPSMTAFLGLAQVLARSVAGEASGRFLERFAVVHHTGRLRAYGRYRDKLTQRRYVHSDSGVPSKPQHFHSPPEDVRPQLDLTFSLLLETRISPERAAKIVECPEIASEIGHRALGGVVNRSGRFLCGGDSLELLERAGRGHAVADLTSELFVDADRDPLDAMLDRLGRPFDRDDVDRPFMSHVGYLTVSDAAMRTGARGEARHVHGEPIFGLAAFRRSYAVDATAPVFWKPSIDLTKEILILKGEPR